MSMVGGVATSKAVTEAAPRETGGEVSGSPLLVTGRVPRSEFERGHLGSVAMPPLLPRQRNRQRPHGAAPAIVNQHAQFLHALRQRQAFLYRNALAQRLFPLPGRKLRGDFLGREQLPASVFQVPQIGRASCRERV